MKRILTVLFALVAVTDQAQQISSLPVTNGISAADDLLLNKKIGSTYKPYRVAASNFFSVTVVASTAQFTNTLNSYNLLGVDRNTRAIQIASGFYDLAAVALYVSNNVHIYGSRASRLRSSMSGQSIFPFNIVGTNVQLAGFYHENVAVSGTTINIGIPDGLGLSGETGVDAILRDLDLRTDTDNLWASLGSTLVDIYMRTERCDLHNKYDAHNLTGSAGGNSKFTFVDCFFDSDGPSVAGASVGESTGFRLQAAAIAEYYNCRFRVDGGTNLTCGGTIFGASTAFFNGGCSWDVWSTNSPVANSVALLTNASGSTVTFDALPVSTNAIKNSGTLIFKNRQNQFATTTTTGTAADTLEKDLVADTINGNSLAGDQQAFDFTAYGSYGATANTKALRVKIGGLTILDTQGLAINGGNWSVYGTVQRVSGTTMKATVSFIGPAFITNRYTSLTLTSSTNIVLRVTGSNHTAAASDLVLEGFKRSWRP